MNVDAPRLFAVQIVGIKCGFALRYPRQKKMDSCIELGNHSSECKPRDNLDRRITMQSGPKSKLLCCGL